MSKKDEQPEIPYEKAVQAAFLNLCAQYQEMGRQMETLVRILGPLLDGDHKITPPVNLTVVDTDTKLN